MEQKIVTLQIRDEFISGAGVSIGAVGSHDDVLLEMDFRNSCAWDGTTKRAIFSNALGEDRTLIILGTNLLAEGQDNVYLVPVPYEAKTVAGEAFLTVEGFIGEGETEKIRIVTEEAKFRVLPSKLYINENPSLTPSEAEQLQAEIDKVKSDIVQAREALEHIDESVNAAATSALDAEAWAIGTCGGEAVPEEDPAHENNSKWWSIVAEAAKTAAEAAKDAAVEAAKSAANALASLVKVADEKIAEAAKEVINAKSWAIGGTGTRENEDTNNAMFWAKQAESAAVSGGVLSFKGRVGFVNPEAGDYTAEMVGARPNTWVPDAEAVGARPDNWMPTAEDVGARPKTWTPTAEDVGAVPVSRTINGTPLSEDIVIPEGVQMELLWQNASPYSGFAAQTVELDLSGYDGVLIQCRVGDQHEASSICVKGYAGSLFAFLCDASKSVGFTDARRFSVTENGVVFSTGYQYGINVGNQIIDENYAVNIPYLIYGIKGIRHEMEVSA